MKPAVLVFLVLLTQLSVSAQGAMSEFESKSIFFGGGNWYVDPQQRQELLQWIDGIPNLHEYEIVIHSHTDNIGSKEYNTWLSQMRSESVFKILEGHDIPTEWLFIRDFGEDNPVFDNDTWEGRLNNRRVDVILVPPST